jgi:hypothetical protein
MAAQKQSHPYSSRERAWTRAKLEKLTGEPLIDPRTGRFRGDPVGLIALCLRPYSCPTETHRHVLWYRNSAPRMTTVCLALEHFPGYAEKSAAFRARQHLLRDLHALLLIFISEEGDLLYPHQDAQGKFHLGATPHTLSASLAQAIILYSDLKRYLSTETTALQAWCQMIDPRPEWERLEVIKRACVDAEATLSLLETQGCVLLHPTLPCLDPLARSAWQTIRQRPTGTSTNIPLTLFWRGAAPTNKHEARSFADLVRTHEPALKYLLAQRAVTQQHQILELRQASLLAQAHLDHAEVSSSAHVRQVAQQEYLYFQAFRERLETNLRTLQDLPVLQVKE